MSHRQSLTDHCSTQSRAADDSSITALRNWALTELTMGQPAVAIRFLFDLLALDPGDVETLLMLGDCYLAGRDAAGAHVFYERAAALADQDQAILTRCKLAETAPHIFPDTWLIESSFPVGAARVGERLDQLIHAGPPTTNMLDCILSAPDPSAVVRARLDEVLTYLPMLIALSASQAEKDGDAQRAQALVRLAEMASS